MQTVRCTSALLASLLLALLCASCSVAHPTSQGNAAGQAPLAMRILAGSQYSSGTFRLERSQAGNRELLELYAYGLTELSSLYIAIPLADGSGQLGNAEHHALDELGADSRSIVRDGELQFSWLAAEDSFSGSGRIASFELSGTR